MTQGTGLPFLRCSRAQGLRAGFIRTGMTLAVLVSGCLAHPPAFGAASQPDDPSLDRTLQVIANAFHAEKPDSIASLVPAEGKTYISLVSFGGGGGYYSRDQVYFIFSKVFTQHDTVKFSVHRQKADTPGKDFVYCIGNWYYHRHDGVDGDSQIHFVLSMKKGAWSLVEIREAQ